MEREYTINICGYQCTIISDQNAEQINKLIDSVSKRIKAITEASAHVSTSMAALLVCMELCEELENLKMSTGNLRMQLKGYFDDASKANFERDEALKEIAKLKREIAELKGESN